MRCPTKCPRYKEKWLLSLYKAQNYNWWSSEDRTPYQRLVRIKRGCLHCIALIPLPKASLYKAQNYNWWSSEDRTPYQRLEELQIEKPLRGREIENRKRETVGTSHDDAEKGRKSRKLLTRNQRESMCENYNRKRERLYQGLCLLSLPSHEGLSISVYRKRFTHCSYFVSFSSATTKKWSSE